MYLQVVILKIFNQKDALLTGSFQTMSHRKEKSPLGTLKSDKEVLASESPSPFQLNSSMQSLFYIIQFNAKKIFFKERFFSLKKKKHFKVGKSLIQSFPSLATVKVSERLQLTQGHKANGLLIQSRIVCQLFSQIREKPHRF